MVEFNAPQGLWEHQVRAVETVDGFLRRDGGAETASLITMPTGTGKSGVIATIVAALSSVEGHRLVLTPWDALVRQLMADIRGRFWDRLPESSRPVIPPVLRLPPSSKLADLPNLTQPTIFVATIAAISVAWRRAAELGYDPPHVFREFGVVIVDEGHYEPAPEWSEAIRGLRRPTVLLTATPYRNDRKYFAIDPAAYYRFPHWRATEERLLRHPEFAALSSAATPESFASEVLKELAARFPREDQARVIIRCGTPTNIRLVVSALTHLGQSAIGVHENFESGGSSLLRQVPLPDACDARFWVHQYKLIEGIDDPRFKVLAFYDALRNDRALVQQIGRILRNPQRDPTDEIAYVFGRRDRDIERTWTGYLRFDRQDEAESFATMPSLIHRMQATQPDSYYYDGAYRVKLALDSPELWKDLLYPLRTRVYDAATSPFQSAEELAAAVAEEWRDLDRTVYRLQGPDRETIVIPFVAADNSPLLRSGLFVEAEFGYTVCCLTPELLFFYDTQGRTPEIVKRAFRPVSQGTLRALFPSAGSRLTSVSLVNTDIGPQSARARYLRAAAIDALAPDLGDYTYACTVAEGYTQGPEGDFRRYLGLSRARITDHRATELDYRTYRLWLDEITAAIADPAEETATFSRYASVVESPDETEAGHVLLDVDEASFRSAESGDPLRIDDTAADVKDGEFTITANGQPHEATMIWDGLRRRYEIRCPSLEEQLFVTSGGESRELVSVVNSEQTLRVVTKDSAAVYAHGEFFRPIIPATRAGAFRLLDVLEPTPELSVMGSEKGHAIVNDDWPASSVFGAISSLAPSSRRTPPDPMAAVLPNADFVLCTDLGTEVADFVITDPSHVCFIHAKASSVPRQYSASALHDVASQAIKNLLYLQPLSDVPMAMGTWTQPWSAHGVDGSTRRLREGRFERSRDMWAHIRRIVAAPNSEREVWLVLGQSLSKSRLESEARRRPPRPEAIQVFALLQAAWSTTSQLGCRLRIFCSP